MPIFLTCLGIIISVLLIPACVVIMLTGRIDWTDIKKIYYLFFMEN